MAMRRNRSSGSAPTYDKGVESNLQDFLFRGIKKEHFRKVSGLSTLLHLRWPTRHGIRGGYAMGVDLQP